MKTHTLISILLFATIVANGQTGTPLAQYSGNQIIYNPAYSGAYDVTAINLSMKKLWVGLPGSPSLISLNAYTPLQRERHAIGMIIQRAEWGALTEFKVHANYAHKIPLADEHSLSLGLQAGLLNYVTDWDKIEYVADWNDRALGEGRQQTYTFDLNLGAFYLTPQWYAGFSVKHLTQPKFDKLIDSLGNTNWYSQTRSQFFLIGGYNYQIDDDWMLRPEVLMRYVHTTPFTAHIGLFTSYQGKYLVGVQWKSSKTITFTARMDFMEHFQIGYTYEISYGIVSAFQKGSHEISLSYRINDYWGRKEYHQFSHRNFWY
jgi:type IX secretion system PorP/SprF family membrane protein